MHTDKINKERKEKENEPEKHEAHPEHLQGIGQLCGVRLDEDRLNALCDVANADTPLCGNKSQFSLLVEKGGNAGLIIGFRKRDGHHDDEKFIDDLEQRLNESLESNGCIRLNEKQLEVLGLDRPMKGADRYDPGHTLLILSRMDKRYSEILKDEITQAIKECFGEGYIPVHGVKVHATRSVEDFAKDIEDAILRFKERYDRLKPQKVSQI